MERLVDIVRDQIKLSRTVDEFDNVFKLNETNIKLLSNYIRNLRGKTKISIGEKKHLENLLGQLKSLRIQITRKLRTARNLRHRDELENRVEWQEIDSAFKSRLRTGTIININITEPQIFFEKAAKIFKTQIKKLLNRNTPALKVNVILCGDYMKPEDSDVKTRKYFNTANYTILLASNIDKIFSDMKDRILVEMEDCEMQGSGWALERIVNLAVNISKFQPMAASSYIELPKLIQRKRAVININNLDNKCFAYAVLSTLYPVQKNADRVTSYPKNVEQLLNFHNINFPMKITDIKKFEKLNPTISINVYGLSKKDKVNGPLYHTKAIKKHHINLLYLSKNGKSHYCWIKNLSRLCSSQLSNNEHKAFICDRCLSHFTSQRILTRHSEDCSRTDAVKMMVPQYEDAELYFKNFQYSLRHPVVIYADFESLVVPLEDNNADEEDESTSFTKPYQQHIPYSVGYQVVCSLDESLSHYNSYRGPNPQRWFIEQLQKETTIIEEKLSKIRPKLPLTLTEQEEYDKATNCRHCQRSFSDAEVIKCCDHCHFTGKFRFALCMDCNYKFKTELDFNTEPINLLPITFENYVSVSKQCGDYTWRFIDSYRFLPQSLDKLARNLASDMFKYTRSAFPDNFELMKRKGVLCYDFLDSWEKLNETKLPLKKYFYSKLTETDISDVDYEHAQKVWNTFNVKTLGDYSDIYLKCDVKILTDVFEEFRNLCMNIYDLDAAHFYTGPGLAWNAALKMTKIKLELLSDIDQILFIEKGLRGGLTQCSGRYSTANNKYMENYDSSRPSNYLFYIDANNLYGYAMNQSLPYGGFEWLPENHIDYIQSKLQNLKIPENVTSSDYSDKKCMSYLNITEENTSMILEVDLKYPDNIHNNHKDLPFCPEHRNPPGSKYTKLMATTHDKKKYVIHIRNLTQCLMHGLKLDKIHRVLKFKQSAWLKPYIDLNTRMRSQATNDFEKDFYKLMNNSFFGKTMENIRKHRIIKLVTSWKQAKKLIAKPNYRNFIRFKENLVAIELNKTLLTYNKPVYLGMTILDLSKLHMYSCHYEFIKRAVSYPETLLYTDTDSFIYDFKDNIYEIVKNETEKGSEGFFDTSDYPINNRYGISKVNKKIMGKFKDELNGEVLTAFIGLRSKMYALKVNGKDHTKKAKGIAKTALKNRITFQTYYDVLFNNKISYVVNRTIRSERHNLFSFRIKKKGLDSKDDKRYILKDGISTLPWGHHEITQDPLDALVNLAHYYI